ncbi:MAG: Cof-type HAD-IIB family hydrolase [Buchananella hordeovulneris]|nr:Cof-type HAD-IIB family hydrolase [Buchananella hordeovulneris]
MSADYLHDLDARSDLSAKEWLGRIGAAIPGSLPPAGPALMICMDIDGTLLRMDQTVSPAVQEALAAHRQAGTRLVLASGRGPRGMRSAAEAMSHTQCWAVCSNGALTARMVGERAPGETGFVVLTEQLYDASAALEKLRRAVPDAFFATETGEGGMRANRPWPFEEFAEGIKIVPFEELGAEPVSRVVMVARGMEVAEFAKRIQSIGLEAVSYAIGWESWLDLTPPGINKATGCDALREQLGISRHATVAIGDGMNDLEMLDWAAFSVAMGQASPRVRRAADFVTAPVGEDGAALLLRALLER